MTSRTVQITSKQCRRARALLKWNPQDVASRSRIPVKRIELFERNQVRLARNENDELVKLFKKWGIEFLPNSEVSLGGKKGGVLRAEGAHIEHGAEEEDRVRVNADGTEKPAEASEEEREEERKRKREEAEARELRKQQALQKPQS